MMRARFETAKWRLRSNRMRPMPSNDSCDLDCTLPACGDGFVNQMAGEECDGNSAGCSSTCVIAPTPPPPPWGMVGVTEIMANPSGTDTGREWFELGTSQGEMVYHLDWCVVRTANGEFVIPPGTSIGPGEYLQPTTMGPRSCWTIMTGGWSSSAT